MKIRNIITCIFAGITGILYAQYQNFELKKPETESKTYIGRDFVRLLPGFKCSANEGHNLQVKVNSMLTNEEANTLLTKTYKNGNWDYVATIDKTKEVGVIPITTSISPTGAKTYNVPIEIVPGRMGFQPLVSLSYNSQDGNGVVGAGWNIEGLASIDRVNQNLYYDNKCGTIDLTTNDKFTLNGERLIQLSNTVSEIEYENSTGNTFVTAYITGNIVKYFRVRYPSGIVGIFGFPANVISRVSYPVTKLTDAIGNSINFTYIEDANTYYIDLISYGGCGETGTPGFMADFARIQFFYTDNRTDGINQYIGDKTVSMTKILRKIVCFANSENYPEKIYELIYSNKDSRIQNSPSTGVSQLTEILCSANGREQNSLKFIYGENISTEISKAETTFSNQSFDLKNVNIVNLRTKTSTSSAFIKFPKHEYLSADGLNLTYPSTEKIGIFEDFFKDTYIPENIEVGNGFLGAIAANIDGNSGDEIIRINSGGMQRYGTTEYYCIEPVTISVFSQGTDNTYSSIGSKNINISYIQTMKMGKKDYIVGDFTGTGKDQLILFFSNTSSIFYLNSFPITQSTIPIGKTTDDDKVLAIDIDGDTQTEIIVVRPAKTDVYKYKNGVGFQDIADWAITTTDFNERQILFADLNQDGNIDIIKSPVQNSVKVTYETRKAPSWFAEIPVNGHYIECEYCHYVQEKSYLNPTNLDIPYCRKHIGVLTGNGISRIVDLDLGNPGSPTDVQPIYPTLIENNSKVLTYCPGCYRKIEPYILQRPVDYRCWACGFSLLFGNCLLHGKNVDRSDWTYTAPVNDKPEMYNEWTYLYTNGKTIVQTEKINGITRSNDYKFSIHEIDGDGVPDLIYQNDAGKVVVCPFNIKTRSFVEGNQSLSGIPFSFDLFDVNMDDDYKNSNMLALGSNKIVNIKFPFNSTRNNMISLMVNSLGVIDKTGYTQLTDKEHYTRGNQAQYPFIDFSGPMWVVSESSQIADKKLTSSVNYNYAGGIYHDQGLDFLGFSSLISTDLMTNKVNATEFNPYQQGVVTRYCSDTEEINAEYDYKVAVNKKSTLLPLRKTIIDKLKGNTLIVSYPLTEYDSFGNAKKEIIDYGNGINTTIVNEYENRIASKNLIGLLRNKEITNERTGNTSVSGESFEYNGNGQVYFSGNYNIKAGTHLIAETNYVYDPDYKTLTSKTIHSYITNNYLTTSYTYWDNDKCSIRTITDPLNRVTEYTYNFTKRLLAESKDEYGKTTVYGYDDWRRVNKITRPDGTVTDITVSWNSGNDPDYLVKETTATTGQPIAYQITDAFGRVRRSSVAGFETDTEVLTDNEYDNFGRLYTSSAPYKTSGTPIQNTYIYDKYDRIEKFLAFNGSITGYNYYGNTVTTNKDGVVSSTTTDATGMLARVDDAGGTVTYTYRADGQPDKINTAGVETGFEYNDPYNRQTKLIDPSAGTIETQYDDTNRKVKQIWDSGKNITTEYNQYGQVFARYTPDFTVAYFYEKGKFKNLTYYGNSMAMSKSNTYDTFGRLWKENEMVDGKTLEQEYLYNQGKLSSVTYRGSSGSNSITYPVICKYNTNGYLYKLVDENDNTLRMTNSINAYGQETSVTFGNGLTTQSIYTPVGVLNNINTTNNIQNTSYDFNSVNGTLNSRTDNKYKLTERFDYGVMYRLEGYGTTTNHQSVAYRSNGSIDTKTDAGTYIYDQNSRPYTLTKINTPDNSGLKTQLDISYTVMSRPTTISNNAYTAYIDYNEAYERVFEELKQGTNVISTKHLLAGGQYEVETKAGVETQRLYLDGSPYSATVVAEKTGGASAQLYFLHRDYLGSITQVSDKFGNLAAEYSYDAWGRMRNVSNWTVYTAGVEPELRFGRGYTGHEHLNRFGLINMNARLYDPVLGRFLAPDPLVASPDESNGYNRYMYATNNPLMYVDIDGEDGYPGGYNGGYPGGYGPYTPNNNYPGTQSPGFNFGGGFNYNGGYSGGGYGGFGGGYSYGSPIDGGFVFGLLNWAFGPHHPPSYYRSLVISVPSQYSTYKPKTVLKNVSGSGTSTVYAGGGKRQRGNNGGLPFPRYPQSGAINNTTFLTPAFDFAQSVLGTALQLFYSNADIANSVAGGLLLVSPFAFGKTTGFSRSVSSGAEYAAETGVELTAHGAQRIAGAAATRGGVLSMEGVNATRLLGRTFTQADGANVFLHEITPGRFNAVIQNQTTGKVITTMNNWSLKSINRIGKNYGWPIQ